MEWREWCSAVYNLSHLHRVAAHDLWLRLDPGIRIEHLPHSPHTVHHRVVQHEQRVESRDIDQLHMPAISGDTMYQIMERFNGVVTAVVFRALKPEQVKYPS